MDIKQALDILNLTDNAYLEDAKASFRTLAKKYHPDKLRINAEKVIANEKMKEINLAFHILKKTLKPREIVTPKKKKPVKKVEPKQTYYFQDLEALIKKVRKKFFKATKAKVKHKIPKSSDQRTKANNFVKKNKTFDSVLNKTIKNSFNKSYIGPAHKNSEPIESKQKIKIKNTYSKYMELKQMMRSKRKHIRSEGFAPIEKISPISPVKKS